MAVYVQGSRSGNRRTDLALLGFLLELGFCFMTVASVPPVNDQSSARDCDGREVSQQIVSRTRFKAQGLFRQHPYLMPMTIESGPIKCSTRASRNPASFIHAVQSAPV